MAEQPAIVADPISSEGSEDSWIFLDEMDDAMNETDGVVNEPSVETAAAATMPEISIESAEVATETYQPPRIEEVYDDDVDGIDFESKIETISSDLIDTCPSDDNSDSEHMFSSQPYDLVSLGPTIDDGSTTDGSISMISDTEFHRYETKPKRTFSKVGKNELNMLMNCRPIDMTVKNPRPTVQIRGRCAMPASVEELAMGKPCIVDEVINLLERLNHFFATTYLGQVFLLFVAIVSLTLYSIMYYRYTNIKLAFADLDQKYFDLEVQSMSIDVKLAQCEYLYKRELKCKNNEPNVPQSIVTEEDQKISATNLKTNLYQKNDYKGPYEMKLEDIIPTKLFRQFETGSTIDKTETISTFDLNNNDDFDEDFVIPSIRDHDGQIVWVGNDEPESPSKTLSDFKNYDDIEHEFFASMFSKSGEVNYDIDAKATIEYKLIESGILSENDFAQKYVHDTHFQHTPTKQHKSMNDESKSRKEEQKVEQTKTKWKKDEVKYNDNVDKYHSSEESFNDRKKKHQRDRIQRKEYGKEIKNNNNKDRKESKGKKDKHDKEKYDSGKWNKAERYDD